MHGSASDVSDLVSEVPAFREHRVERLETYVVDGGWRNFLIVKVTTDTGITGWGDGTLGWKEFAVEQLVKEFGERYVTGSDPFRISDLWFRLYQVEHGNGPAMYAAMAGIETALWDVVGKACGRPVVDLAGGRVRDTIRAYANGWYSAGNDIAKLLDQAQEVLSLGYTAMKIDPFGVGGREISKKDLRSACRLIGSMRETLGPDIDLLIEFHGRFSVGMAIEAIRAMQDFDPMFCEEPVPAGSVAAQGFVTKAASAFGARVATGEHVYARFGFAELLREHGAHVIQPDLGYSGGFAETKLIAAMAEADYVSVAPHNCDGPGKLAASVHLCANMPNFLILETFEDFDVPWRKDLAIGGPSLQAGFYTVPSAAGWGYEINEDVAREHPGRSDARMNMWAESWEARMCR
jgi:galactonate dehydratase